MVVIGLSVSGLPWLQHGKTLPCIAMPVLMISLGSILLLGLLASGLADRTPLPRVTLLLLVGVVIGPSGLDWIPLVLTQRFEWIVQLTLLMVGFLIGGKLSRHGLSKQTGHVLAISLVAALLPMLLVALGLLALGVPTQIALLLGCMAAATAPAAVLDVVEQMDVGAGPRHRFGSLLLAITALDDVWALLLFGGALALSTALTNGAQPLGHLLWAGRDLLGGLFLGAALGLPAAVLTGRIRDGQPMLLEALGIVLLCGGLALQMQVSFLIAAIAMGAVIANLAHHHEYPFHAIEGIELPFMALFFILAGASLDLAALVGMGWLGLAYLVLRTAGKVIGAAVGARLSGADRLTRRWTGTALLPQAGVSIGMALVAASQIPDGREMLLSITIGSTVLFELFGPLLARLAISRFAISGAESGDIRLHPVDAQHW